MFFAKSDKSSNRFRELMITNKISKVYLARVRGNFEKCKNIEKNEIEIKNMIYCVSNIDALWECSE